jgi:hypothetical protein
MTDPTEAAIERMLKAWCCPTECMAEWLRENRQTEHECFAIEWLNCGPDLIGRPYRRRAEAAIAALAAGPLPDTLMRQALLDARALCGADLDAAAPALAGVNNLIDFAAAHGFRLEWPNGEPPLVHAWRAIIDRKLAELEREAGKP